MSSDLSSDTISIKYIGLKSYIKLKTLAIFFNIVDFNVGRLFFHMSLFKSPSCFPNSMFLGAVTVFPEFTNVSGCFIPSPYPLQLRHPGG